jgi:uncharacterized membrane protein YbhN (UPF0104 family)
VKRLLGKVLLGVAVGVAVYVALSVWADASAVKDALAGFSWAAFAAALGLTTVNYVIRFARWHYYLGVLELEVPLGESLLVFLAGFSLTVTPGKLGEAVKALLLRESRGISAVRTAPIVIAERLTDLVGCLLLAAIGAFTFDVNRTFLLVVTGLILGGLGVISIEPLARACLALLTRLPGVGRFAPKLGMFYETTATLVRPGPLLLAVVLAVACWYCECLGFWLIVRGFPGAHIDLFAATFIYAAMTLAGAMSFLPGGLGVTEAGMLALLGKFASGAGRGVALAATFLTRLATLWFAVVIGLGALVLFARRKHVSVDLPLRS